LGIDVRSRKEALRNSPKSLARAVGPLVDNRKENPSNKNLERYYHIKLLGFLPSPETTSPTMLKSVVNIEKNLFIHREL
jgi:hypothetical protein